MKNAELLVNGGRPNGRRLQSVAQRLVVEHDDGRPLQRRVPIPVVDQRLVYDGPAPGSGIRDPGSGSVVPESLSAAPRAAATAAIPTPLASTTPLHIRPSRTECWMAGCMISSTVTARPRPAIAALWSATYRRAPAAVTRSCTTAKTTSAATAVMMRIARGRTTTIPIIRSGLDVGGGFASQLAGPRRRACMLRHPPYARSGYVGRVPPSDEIEARRTRQRSNP
jgi:hypothetical protein